MPAYLIAEVDVHDPITYEAYKARAAAAVAQYGGVYIARGGEAELLEGWPAPRRVVIIRFPDRAAVTAWYRSPAYQALIPLREQAAELVLISFTD